MTLIQVLFKAPISFLLSRLGFPPNSFPKYHGFPYFVIPSLLLALNLLPDRHLMSFLWFDEYLGQNRVNDSYSPE